MAGNAWRTLEPHEAQILRMYGEGASSRQIAAWLSENGTPTSHNTVNGFIRSRRAERAEVAKAVTAQRLAGSVTSDLDRLEEIRAEVAARAAAQFDDAVYQKLAKLEFEILVRRMTLAGANQPGEGAGDSAEFEAARDRVRGRLARLAAAAVENAARTEKRDMALRPPPADEAG